jgi:CO/xanthine dehydrogenase FAD-binding subunit
MGACTPIAAFEREALLREHAPVLAQCAVWFADAQIRAQATVAGNLVNASPAADCTPPLLAMNTQLTLVRREAGVLRERTVPLSEFVTGPGRTVCGPRELVARLTLDALPGHGAAFEKVGHRRSLVISTVCLAALVRLDAAGRMDDVRVAIGAVGPVPERLADVEDSLTGRAPTPALLRETALRVAERVRSRSRQAYRREALVNMVERGLVAALADAGLRVARLPKESAHV